MRGRRGGPIVCPAHPGEGITCIGVIGRRTAIPVKADSIRGPHLLGDEAQLIIVAFERVKVRVRAGQWWKLEPTGRCTHVIGSCTRPEQSVTRNCEFGYHTFVSRD